MMLHCWWHQKPHHHGTGRAEGGSVAQPRGISLLLSLWGNFWWGQAPHCGLSAKGQEGSRPGKGSWYYSRVPRVALCCNSSWGRGQSPHQ